MNAALGALPAEQLLHALRVDQDKRWRQGQPLRAEQYFNEYPLLADDADHMVVLIFGEVMAREQLGEKPALIEYQERFPKLAERLATLFAHRETPTEFADHTYKSGSALTAKVHAEDEVGQPPVVPGYEILGHLGHGGMGVVYKARQLSLNRLVALKMIHAGGFARPEQLADFRREAELMARIQHPNIVQVFEVKAEPGNAFLAMEFIEGGSLAERIGGQPQDARWAARIIETVALAIHEAHCKGIVHRDLKPGNILLHLTCAGTHDKEASEEEQASRTPVAGLVPKIVDFGLAHVVDDRNQMSTTSAYLGTPCYMAPEQADGRPKDIGPCTDIYALGAILYELLTGQPPFCASSPWETLVQIKTQEPLPPTRSQPNIPRDLETICLKCLEKAPERRYATAALLANDLRRWRQGEPISARPVNTLEKAYRWCRRNPGWAAMVLSSALLLVVVSLVEVFSNLRLEAELTKTEKQWRRAEDAETALRAEHGKTMAAKRLIEEKQWEALTAQAASLRTSQRSGQRFESLRVLQDALALGRDLKFGDEKINRLRDLWITTSAVPDLFADQQWPGYPAGSVAVDFDGSLETYARMDDKGNCSVRSVAGDQEICFIPAPKGLAQVGPNDFPLLSRDGRCLALCFDDGTLRLYNLDKQNATLILTAKNVFRVDFDSQGKSLVLAHRDGTLSWYDPATGKLKNKLAPRGVQDPHVALHPSQPLVAVWGSKEPNAEVRDLRDGKPEGFVASGSFAFADMAWLPDGTTLAASIPKGVVFHERAAMYKQTGFLPTSLGPAVLTFSGDGALLAGVSWNHEVHLINAASGQALFSLPPTTTPMARLRFNKDGTKLAARGRHGQLAIWKVAQAREQRLLSNNQCPGPSKYISAAISPKSPRLVAVGMEEGLGFWDLETGAELSFKTAKGTMRVLFEPSGDLLTCGQTGTFRWPVRMVETRLHVGPPESISHVPAPSDLATDRTGKVLAISASHVKPKDHTGGVLIQRPGQPDRVFGKGLNLKNVAVSPDGRWVACALESQTKLIVWDLQDGTIAKEFSAHGNVPAFSADGTWLAVSGEKGAVLKVGTWDKTLAFSGQAAFTHDGKTLAVETGGGIIRLLDAKTGKEFANLEDPNLAVAEKLFFTADDSRLITINNGPQPGLRVWDLTLVRRNLSEAGLDWQAPAAPTLRSGPPLPPIEIELGL